MPFAIVTLIYPSSVFNRHPLALAILVISIGYDESSMLIVWSAVAELPHSSVIV